jgi:hypothetical protein
VYALGGGLNWYLAGWKLGVDRQSQPNATTVVADTDHLVYPPNPAIPAMTPKGAVVAGIVVSMSDGSAFTGTLGFGPPSYDDGGIFAISGSNLIINPNGPGVGSDGGSTENCTELYRRSRSMRGYHDTLVIDICNLRFSAPISR